MKETVNWRAPSGSRFGEAEGRAMVEEFLTSGVSAAEFSRRHGVAEQKIGYWLRRVGKSAPAVRVAKKRGAGAISFVPVRTSRVRNSAPAGHLASEPTLHVQLGGREVSVTGPWSASSIAQWLSALEAQA